MQKKKYIYIYIYIYIFIYIYIEKRKKLRDYTFIPTSLFRDYSLIRGFHCQEYW